jgi:hypothetical protein
VPAEAVIKKQPYPTFQEARKLMAERTEALFPIEKPESPHNVFVLGVFAAVIPELDEAFSFFSFDGLRQAIAGKLTRGLEDNLQAFQRGYAYGQSLLQRA